MTNPAPTAIDFKSETIAWLTKQSSIFGETVADTNFLRDPTLPVDQDAMRIILGECIRELAVGWDIDATDIALLTETALVGFLDRFLELSVKNHTLINGSTPIGRA